MNVLLINPPFQRLKGMESLHFPLGLGYVAAAAARDGHDVRIYDAELSPKGEDRKPIEDVSLLDSHHKFVRSLEDHGHPIWREVSRFLNMFRPDVVGITLLTPLYGSARRVTSLCKEFSSQCTVVWGGVHPTIMADEVLRAEKNVDYVVRGEGDITFRELLGSLERGGSDLHRVDGLSFRDKGTVKHNKNRTIIKELDSLPFPARDLLLNEAPDNRIFRNIMSSRGCPYNCAYCSSTQFWTRKVRYRSIPDVIREIRHLIDRYQVTELEFWDDTFTLNRKRTRDFCENIISEKLNLSWWCNTRPDRVDEDILRTMKKAGCDMIHIGVESGSERTLSYLDRELSIADVKKASRLLLRCGINWTGYFMIGFPYESVEDIEKTRELMRGLSVSGAQLSVFTPYPGTRLFEICKKEGLIPDNPEWSHFSHQSPENHFVKNIGKEEFARIVTETAQEFDRANKSLRTRMRRVMARRKYYLHNPGVFFKKLRIGLSARFS